MSENERVILDNKDFLKTSDNVYVISKFVWEDDDMLTCQIRYLVDEDCFYVFFYSKGSEWCNNCAKYENLDDAINEFEYRIASNKNKSTIKYNLKKSIALSKLS